MKGFKKIYIIVLSLLIFLAASGYFLLDFYKDKIDKGTEYSITVKFNSSDKTLDAEQEVIFTNEYDAPLKEVYFHIYPNAFKDKNSLPFLKEDMALAYPKGFKEGFLDLNKVYVNGNPANFEILGSDKTLLKILLPSELKPGEKIKLKMSYLVKIPPSMGRFGYGENTVNITNWYPILSVYTQNGWDTHGYYRVGDPFYSDIADYSVIITLPKEYTVATTGVITRQKLYDNEKKVYIQAKRVRDFAMVLSDRFNVMEDKVGNVTVKSYSFDQEMGSIALKYAKDALKFFSDYIGEYPYRTYSVVAADFYIGGMEYPNLVLIDKNLYKKESQFLLEYVIAHETAHQWWYGIVGNDEVKEAWLDEGLTEYSTLLYIEKFYGKEAMNEIYDMFVKKEYELYKRKIRKNKLLRSLDEFGDWREYNAVIYDKAAMVFHDLRQKVGDDAFKKIIQSFYNDYKFKNASTADFISVCEKVAGQKLREFFDERLN